MVRGDGPAMPLGADASQLSRHLNQVHDEFVQTGRLHHSLRRIVVDSWQRSVHTGLDPEYSLARVPLDAARLAEIRAGHPLAVAMPLIRRLLVDAATEAGLLVAVSDAAGQLLWVEGSHVLRSKAEAMHFMPGADWSEESAGTNAPGTALALGRPVQILGAEHLVRQVTPWSCSAAPIREPDTGAILGVLDITGGTEVVTSQTMALVRATVAAVEAELRLDRLSGSAPPRRAAAPARPRLSVLGRRRAVLSHERRVISLSLRHSEIMLLLAVNRDGFTAGELAVALSEDEHSTVTIRAELSRLRTELGPIELGSRPYALQSELATDLHTVRSALAAGQLRNAVAAYRGPVLPSSIAPAVVELRDDLHRLLRSRLLACGDADAILAFADTPYGHDDYDIWLAARDALPSASPRGPEVAAHLEALDASLS
jgi:transcriptional regulator of acetoin/glycerol metabolism